MFREFDITIIFAKFQLMIEKLLSCFIQIIHLDGDGEFDNKLFCFFLDSYGIHINCLVHILLPKIVLLRENILI